MNTSDDVRIWKIWTRKNSAGKATSYGVRWRVKQERFYESFPTAAAADSFRSQLISAQRRGEPFLVESPGLPRSMWQSQKRADMSWFDFTWDYVAMRWPDSAATTRQTLADALIRVAPVFVPDILSAPDAAEVRSVLRQWGYNSPRRSKGAVPDDAKAVLDWLSRNGQPVSTAARAETVRALQRAVTRRLDGAAYSPSVARKTRSTVWNVLEYAVEKGLLDENPLAGVKWTGIPKGKRKVDARSVPNPIQARSILEVIRESPYYVKYPSRSGKYLYAYFATMYFAALRPEEAAALNKRNLSLPAPVWDRDKQAYEYGWGHLHLEGARPHVGNSWTDAGTPRDQRGLKSRGAMTGRSVPCPPELSKILQEHITKHGVAQDGRVFSSEQGGEVPKITHSRVWRKARRIALAEDVQATPLAARPYDLRHACVSLWLKGGVEPPQVAEWAGHSVEVLLETYAAVLDSGGEEARRKIQAALGHRA